MDCTKVLVQDSYPLASPATLIVAHMFLLDNFKFGGLKQSLVCDAHLT